MCTLGSFSDIYDKGDNYHTLKGETLLPILTELPFPESVSIPLKNIDQTSMKFMSHLHDLGATQIWFWG